MKRKIFIRWFRMLLASFLMYEALWSVIQLQYGWLRFNLYETLWDLAQCVFFTLALLGVNLFFSNFRDGRYARKIIELVCMLAVSSLLILIVDKIKYVQNEDNSFWNIIDIYIICIICLLLSIIDIQHSYHNRLLTIKQKQMQLRLNLLQQQLSPHTVFNSLSSLQGMIATDTEKAEAYVVTLSNIMRYITENIGKEKIALTDALNFIMDYVKMQEARFPNHFVFNIDTSNMPKNAYIIPISLQVVVENAIKHNNHSPRNPLEISISFREDVAEVSNKKQPVAVDNSLGVGLKNLDERYRLLNGNTFDISETQEYYTVKIPLIYESIDR